ILMGRIASGPTQNNLYTLHESVGALILILMTLRIIYRLSHGAPPPEPTLKPWERTASQTVHWVLYGLLLSKMHGLPLSSALVSFAVFVFVSMLLESYLISNAS
ncbi:MAG: hypothetical protein ABJB49_09750, partial [Nitrospirota bacterium]